jgi:hypothetical protein
MKELMERDATGATATIYDEIRRFCAVPYVSSMQRHLATRPGWLEWVWAALRPAFASGKAQTAAWRASDKLVVPRLAPMSRAALRVWGVDDKGEASIRAVCDSFIRASPTNLMLSGMLRKLPESPEVLAALDAYRKTSPEMVVFSRLIRDAVDSRA